MSWNSPDTRFHAVINEEEEDAIRPDFKPVPELHGRENRILTSVQR